MNIQSTQTIALHLTEVVEALKKSHPNVVHVQAIPDDCKGLSMQVDRGALVLSWTRGAGR